MKKFVRYSFLLMFLLTGILSNAQSAEMADGLRSEGKIYVVVLIILMVLLGLIVYLFLMDKKLNRLEKLLNEKRQTKF